MCTTYLQTRGKRCRRGRHRWPAGRGGWPGGPAGRADCCTYCCTGLSMSACVGRSRSLTDERVNGADHGLEPDSRHGGAAPGVLRAAVALRGPRSSCLSHGAAPIAGMEWCVGRKRSAIWPEVVDGRERQTGHGRVVFWRRRARRGLTPSEGVHGRPSRCPVACPTSRRRAAPRSWRQPLICGMFDASAGG